ncbi:hypothetical protein FHG87_006543 [Trinorchestia longiramus]|nr:hypothetical protein FHG87_006543 [Trinorchestia longiramus]
MVRRKQTKGATGIERWSSCIASWHAHQSTSLAVEISQERILPHQSTSKMNDDSDDDDEDDVDNDDDDDEDEDEDDDDDDDDNEDDDDDDDDEDDDDDDDDDDDYNDNDDELPPPLTHAII